MMADRFAERFGDAYGDAEPFIELAVADRATGRRLDGFELYPDCRVFWRSRRAAP